MSSSTVETDSQGAYNLLNKKKSNKTKVFWVISKIQDLAKDFYNVKVQYIPRLCNVIAHSLDKLTLDYQESVIWTGSFLENIMYLFQSSN